MFLEFFYLQINININIWLFKQTDISQNEFE
jgi:hypothetical protein